MTTTTTRIAIAVATIAVAAATAACGIEELPPAEPSSAASVATTSRSTAGAAATTYDFTRADYNDPTPRTYSKADSGAVVSEPGSTTGCTLGPAVQRGVETGFLVAGHCLKSGQNLLWRHNYESTRAEQLGAGIEDAATTGINAEGKVVNAGAEDSAVVWTAEAADDVDTVAGRFVRDKAALEFDDVWQVAGTKICVDGGATGLQCGNYRERLGNNFTLTLPRPTKGGDSGSTVFIVDAAHNDRATPVGIYTGMTGGLHRATLTSVALNRLTH